MTKQQVKDLREIARLMDELGMLLDELDEVDEIEDLPDEAYELLEELKEDEDFTSKASTIQWAIGDLSDEDMGL